MPQEFTYDPYDWLPSLFRALREYIEDGIDAAVKAGVESVGLQAYEIIFDFPSARLEPKMIPFRNDDGNPVTLIHFDIDTIDNTALGFGQAQFAETLNPSTQMITPEEAHGHEIHFDVGVWATDESGGSTARLNVYGVLDSLFSGPAAQNACESATGGVQIRSYGGGRFLTETVNDIRLYRVSDVELVCFVFSSKKVGDAFDSEIVQNPELMIDETIIVDVQP